MNDVNDHIERAKDSLWFSGARIDRDLSGFLDDHGPACVRLGTELRDRARHVFLAGSGGSWASLQTAKYILDRVLDIGSDALPSYELIWRRPALLGPGAVVFVASYSGETEDSVAALRCAKSAGATTVAIVGKLESRMAREADHVVAYENGAIYELPIATLVLFAQGLTQGTAREDAAAEVADGLRRLPDILRRTLAAEASAAESKARELLRANHLYVLGAGPLAPLAYKVAMSVIMENVRIGASFSDTSEWRHGPAEALERIRPDIIVLLGTDESRAVSERTIEFCRANGARVLVYDSADLGDVHPLLTPLVLNSHTQWLVAYSAILRGITDLDARVFMGHNVLAADGAAWP